MGSLPAKFVEETADFITETFSFVSSLGSDPLFSIFVALYALLLLYFPQIFFNLIFSSILFSTIIILSTLLRLGSSQKSEKETFADLSNEYLEWVTTCDTADDQEVIIETEQPKIFPKNVEYEFKTQCYDYFVEWNVGAPLEIIYEEHEGEEESDSSHEQGQQAGTKGCISLSMCYPEYSDTESMSSNEDYPDISSFRWDEDDEKEDSLIEIQLDHGKLNETFQLDEENMIEIDISSYGGGPVDMES